MSIQREGDRYRLEFRRTLTQTVRITGPDGENFGEKYETRDDAAHPQSVFVLARSIILAMPRRSLELVEWEGWSRPEVKQMVGSVLMQHAFKLLLGYDHPWWRTGLDLVAGRSITDLPVRQIYYSRDLGAHGTSYAACEAGLGAGASAARVVLSARRQWPTGPNPRPRP